MARGVEEPALFRSTLRLEPSIAQLESLPAFPARWLLNPQEARDLRASLSRRGFSPRLVDELASRLRLNRTTGEGMIEPDRALLGLFSEAERSAWHAILVQHPANETYRWPVSLGAAEMSALAAEPRWREALARVAATAIRSGDRTVFGDLFALEGAFATSRDRIEFFRTALGSDVLILKLRRKTGEPLDPVGQAAWWQVNGRYRSIEPILNAIASIPDAPRLDVTHVLPRLARSLMNTFPPYLSEAADPGVESSLMASDFFALAPGADQREEAGFKNWLGQSCVPVAGPLRYGDLIVYGDIDRTSWPYTVVYIAGGIGFARRPTAFGPWQFIDLSEIGRLNPRFAGREPRIYRSKVADIEPDEPPFIPGRMPDAWRQNLSLKPLKDGPWGRLWYYEVLLAPPADTLERLQPPDPTPVWTFAGITHEQLIRAVDNTDMAEEIRSQLRELVAQSQPADDGTITLRPSLDLVLGVPRAFRSAVFPKLVGGLSVEDYAQHIPFPTGFTIEQWFDAGSLPESVRQAALRLVYPSGDRVMLSDFGAFYHILESKREQLSAQRAALRVPGIVLLLEKPAPDEVPEIAAYWRRVGRAKSVDRLLSSFATQDDIRYLDIIHLLSPVEREFVNTYFMPSEPSLTPSCFWTAFNFGEDEPDDRFLVVPGVWTEQRELAWQVLNEKFDRISTPNHVGDIIGYRRAGAEALEHVCVFLADDLAYTKNGYAFSAPWCISRIQEIDEMYLTGPDVERVYFRRRATSSPTGPSDTR